MFMHKAHLAYGGSSRDLIDQSELEGDVVYIMSVAFIFPGLVPGTKFRFD